MSNSGEQKEFDLLALKRLSIHKYRRPTGNAPVSPFSEAIWHSYGPDKDPNLVLRKKDNEIYRYLVGRDYRGEGICGLRTGLDSRTDEWAAACRQILAGDGVLPSSEELLATLPEGAKACGYKGE